MEKLSKPNMLIASTAILGGLLLAGCSETQATSDPNALRVSDTKGDFTVTHAYGDGKRITSIPNGSFGVANSYEFCDANDLVEYWNGGHDGGPERTQDHPACDDGALTPSDFEIEG